MALIETTRGNLLEEHLDKHCGTTTLHVGRDNEENVEWVEYYIGDELVHRSAHVTLTGLINQGHQGEL